jgi:hypothetical protein
MRICLPAVLASLCLGLLAALGPEPPAPVANLHDGATPTCTPGNWRPPAETTPLSISALLKNIPSTATWASVPSAVKNQLQQAANERLAAYRARWSAAPLAVKDAILTGCPTPAMTTAMDDFYRKTYDTVVTPNFALKTIGSAELHRALVRNYLGTIAAARAGTTYPTGKLPNRDWDGISVFDSISLPDQQTYDDIRAYNAALVSDLKKISDQSLDDPEKALRQRVLYDARANAAGGSNNGDGDMESACSLIASDYNVLGGYQLDKKRPIIFADDDVVLREVNAIYLNTFRIKWLDIGTLNSALNFCDAAGKNGLVATLVGNPSTNEVARAMLLLKKWWLERISTSAGAHTKCTVYTPEDRTRIWEAFSASQQFNNDGELSMDAYRAMLASYTDTSRRRYRTIAKLALANVFRDDTVLTPAQRGRVVAAIEAESAFGSFPEKIRLALDAAQGTTNGPASVHWQNALAKYVERLGGGYGENDHIRPDEDRQLKQMFEEVKTWVAREHQGYPIDIASLYPHITYTIDVHRDIPETIYPGTIVMGLGTSRSKLEYYSWIIHELRHAVWMSRVATATDKSAARNDEGLAIEGSGVAVEAQLLEPFAKAIFKNDTAFALYELDYGIRDARYAGTTDATLQRYFRPGCAAPSDANTIDFTRNIAISYGLTGPVADTVALRSHAGTQYLQYIMGGLHVLDTISYLQDQIDPTRRQKIDPYVLFACGLNNPSRDPAYVAALKTCMKL